MDLERRTIRKITVRIVPFLVLCYIAAYLDRVNIGFAAPSMTRDLGLTSTAYALGAGVFFLTYFLFEVPTILLLARFGARKWIARIMFTWGLLSGAMAFVAGPRSFYVVRMLLGLAEAGFFPGIIEVRIDIGSEGTTVQLLCCWELRESLRLCSSRVPWERWHVSPQDRVRGSTTALVGLALDMEGTCTGEHGIGYGKLKHLQREHGEALTALRTLKDAFDPENRLNPGKMIPPVA